jgi:O-antigen/teichoic acid export membrane protein
MALPLLVLPFVTRTLAPEEYGAWVLAYAFGTTASAFANVGFPMVYERSYFESSREGRSAALLWTTVAFVASTLTAALIGTWAWRETFAVAVMHDQPRPELLFWTTCAVGVASLKTYFLVYFRNAGEARRHALFTVQESLLGAACSVLLVAVLHTGPVGLAWGPLAASAIVLVQLCAHFARRLPLQFAWAPLGESMRLAFPLLPRVALSVFGQVFDKWLVGAVAATGGVAAYAIGQRLAYGVFTFSTALENVFQPRTYQLMFDSPAAGAAIGRMLTPYVYATVGVALAAGVFADEALLVLAPQSYAGASAVAGVLVAYFAILFFGKQPQLLYAKKTAIVSALSSASILINALAMWLLATRYGALGAAAGTAIAGALTTFAFVIVSQRYYRIEYERSKFLLMYSILLLALVLVHGVLHDVTYPAVLAVKVGILAAYAGLGAALGYWRALARGASSKKALASES